MKIIITRKKEKHEFDNLQDAAKFLNTSTLKIRAFANVYRLKYEGWKITIKDANKKHVPKNYVKESGYDILYK